MVSKRTWEEFRDSGFLWWVNIVLHTFGWAIVVNVDDKNNIAEVFPARVKYRGFITEQNTEGYIKVSEYLEKEAKELSIESKLP